jgi:hypothetical protein
MPTVSVVTEKQEVFPIKGARYGDLGDAAGDIDGGDFLNMVANQHPNVKITEIRIILDKPLELKPFE